MGPRLRQGSVARSTRKVTPSLRWLADENFNNDIVRALLRRSRELDIVRAQDVRLSGVEDPRILEWAASEERIILTHDVATMTAYAYARVVAGESMPGIFEVGRDVPIAIVVEDILLLAACRSHNFSGLGKPKQSRDCQGGLSMLTSSLRQPTSRMQSCLGVGRASTLSSAPLNQQRSGDRK